MLLSLRVNNYAIFNNEVEFSMYANMQFKRFSNNVVSENGVNALKTAVIIGPNNTGKTNIINCLAALQQLMLNRGIFLNKNLFSKNDVVELRTTFLQDGKECLFEIKYDVRKKEYLSRNR